MNNRSATAFIDALFLILMVLVILPHEPSKRSEPQVDIYSELIFAARWSNDSINDIDLWVQAPGEYPVGYNNQRGDALGFVWDDVGKIRKPPWRYEAIMARKVTDGEYIVNVHAYQMIIPPETIIVEVWRKTPEGAETLWTGSVTLHSHWGERTAIRFSALNGKIVPGSFHKEQVLFFDLDEDR